MSDPADRRGRSWLEASARERVRGLLDDGSFREVLGPERRETSPHLRAFDLPVAFDDGAVVGAGALDNRPVLVAAQEGRFMGGTFGEVSGAKITGVLRAARDAGRTRPVLLLLDTGGVRLQEANAGELAVSEIVRAIAEARANGVAVLALVGGRAGAFGGGGIIAACCSRIVVSRHARIGVTGPEVIETNRGVEEFDAKDRALVWRVTGGRTRRLSGGADAYVRDAIGAFRDAAVALLDGKPPPPLDGRTMAAEQARLEARLAADGAARDATALWARRAIARPDAVADLTEDEFAVLCASEAETHDAR